MKETNRVIECYVLGGDNADDPVAVAFLTLPMLMRDKSAGFHPADGRRLAACWNACIGMTIEELEQIAEQRDKSAQKASERQTEGKEKQG